MLEQLLRPGRGAVLVFTDPACGHCNPLLPELGRDRGEHEAPLAVISRGPHGENQSKAQEHGIATMLLQQDFEVSEAYGAAGMPSAVLIDAEGRIASERVRGTEAVGELLQAPAAPRLAGLHVAPDRVSSHQEAGGA